MRRKLITYAAILYGLITLWLGIQFALTAKQADAADRVDIASRNLLIALLDAETGQRGFLLTGDRSYLEPFESGRQLLNIRLDELTNATAMIDQKPTNMSELYNLTQQKLLEMERTINLRHDDANAAVQIVRSDAGKHLMDQIRGNIDTLQLWAITMHEQLQSKATALARTDFVSLVATFFLAALAVAVRRAV
jgi:CHASE3 domain sensor protein